MAATLMPLNSKASLDLLAGVEAGIDSHTSMTTSDLNKTQDILSTLDIGKPYSWLNQETGIRYQITIDHTFSYGRFPCLSYNLIIELDDKHREMTLNACRNYIFKWISLSSESTAL